MRRIAFSGVVPVILSTGMSWLSDVEIAYRSFA